MDLGDAVGKRQGSVQAHLPGTAHCKWVHRDFFRDGPISGTGGDYLDIFAKTEYKTMEPLVFGQDRRW